MGDIQSMTRCPACGGDKQRIEGFRNAVPGAATQRVTATCLNCGKQWWAPELDKRQEAMLDAYLAAKRARDGIG